MSAEQLYPQSQPPGGAYTPTAEQRPRTVRARPPGRNGSFIATILALVIAIVLLAIAGGLYYLDRSFAGKIYPNVTVQGLAVGELTPREAEAALRARYGMFLQQPATVSYGGRTWNPSLEELGMHFDFAGAVNQAYGAGRGHGMFDNVREVAAIWQNGLDLPLRISYDEQKTQQYIADMARTIDMPPADATLQVDGAMVTTTRAQIGRQLMVNDAVAEISAGLREFRQTSVELQIREIPPRLADEPVQAAAAQIRSMLREPVTLTVGEQSYAWEPNQIAGLLQIARVQGVHNDTLTVDLNVPAIERRIKQIADETEIVGTRPRVAWNNGDLKITKPGKNGWRIDEANARDLTLAAIQGGPRTFELLMRETPPPINETNLHTLGITDLVSVGKSDFTGSAGYRIHNIGVGMNILNGILIAPGEEFSFNENIGNIDASQGFVEGAAIVQNRTQQEFGGGICQDSTTLFRAAFWAGLPITERWGHSFYISWYDKYALGPLGNGPGVDATIFTGGPDLKFLNDTGSWLLLRSWSDPKTGVAQVELYGTQLNRRVELTQRVYNKLPAPGAPVYVVDAAQPAGRIRQSDTARGGMTIDVVRTVYENGVARDPDLFRTRFRPWPNIYVVNPADMGPDGRPLVNTRGEPTQPPPPPADQPLPPVDQQPPADQPLPPVDQQPPADQPAPAPGTGEAPTSDD